VLQVERNYYVWEEEKRCSYSCNALRRNQWLSTDFPCTIHITNDILVIKRVNPETTVDLPLNRIMAFSSMIEENFMLKYHGQAVNTSKAKGMKKYYLVVEYDKGILAFWGQPKNMENLINCNIYRSMPLLILNYNL